MDNSGAVQIAAKFEKAMKSIKDAIEILSDSMKKFMKETEEVEKTIVQGPPWFRQKKHQERALLANREYSAEIKRIDRERPFKRIYKPPKRIRRNQEYEKRKSNSSSKIL